MAPEKNIKGIVYKSITSNPDFDRIYKAKRLIETVIEDFRLELTPTLKYDFYLRLTFALELLEEVYAGAEKSQG
ncbi:MAG: hypothetical protein H0Z28_07995 [Archaeoglobus sp.]|nr:hypothetical protein [Archaeoglobus sp.]